MKYGSAYKWCQVACSRIKHPADRKEVMAELEGHFADRIDELKKAGYEYNQALSIAEENMGDAGEVARLLARVHTPWLSCCVSLSKVFLALCIAAFLWFSLPTARMWVIGLKYGASPDEIEAWEESLYLERANNAHANGGRTYEIAPGGGFESTGYAFSVSRGYFASVGQSGYLVFEVDWRKSPWNQIPYGVAHQSSFFSRDGDRLKSNCSFGEGKMFFEVFTDDFQEVLWRYDFAKRSYEVLIERAAQ